MLFIWDRVGWLHVLALTPLGTVGTVEAKLRLNAGAGNESLTQEKPPPPSSARAKIRKELLLPGFFLTPSLPQR